jgi:arsenate reductase (glutaredoxin)
MVRIYHNAQCRKSRLGLAFLQAKEVSHEVVEYMKQGLTEKELERLIIKLNVKPIEMVRTQEQYYKENLRGKHFDDHEWISILAENPRLLKRPVIEGQYKAVLGDPVENIDLIIK